MMQRKRIMGNKTQREAEQAAIHQSQVLFCLLIVNSYFDDYFIEE
jgi:hypothetical protein